MFVVPDVVPNTEDEGGKVFKEEPKHFMALKPMNRSCQIFNQKVRSYRDLPLRMAEFGCCHRNEAHGALHGLLRVRQMTQDDAHIFCREDQIESECTAFCDLLGKVYADLGFTDLTVKLATRPAVRAGSDDVWDRAEQGLRDALGAAKLDYVEAPGDGAFYGPKLEFHVSAMPSGQALDLQRIQLDFVLPRRVGSYYVSRWAKTPSPSCCKAHSGNADSICLYQ